MAAEDSQAALAGTSPRQVRERAVLQVGDDLFDDGVPAVMALGLEQLERRVGEHGVVAPDREQLGLHAALLFGSRTRRTISRAVTAWPFFEANAVKRDLGDLGVADP